MASLLEKLMRLPMDVMISSMETMTQTMQEIQQRSEKRGAGVAGGVKGKDAPSALGNAPRLAITPLFEMYKIPTSGLASGFKTISEAMQDIREKPQDDKDAGVDPVAHEVDAEIVPLDDREAGLQGRAALTDDFQEASGNALWQIGRPGRSDYAGAWSASFDYRVGKDVDPLGNPGLPHLLSVRDGPQSSGATEKLNIHFTLERDYAGGELALVYDRWGGEKDRVYVDDEMLAAVAGAGRGRLRRAALSMGELLRGDHVITITTSGDTTEKEHRIDFLKLTEVGPPTAE